MKILFCTHPNVDCGLDTLYDGLCRVIGYENIYEYPIKYTLHGGTYKKYEHFPLYFNYPINTDDRTSALRKNKFDIILVTSRIRHDTFFEILKEKSKTISTFILDMSDFDLIEEELINELNAILYFKREYYRDRTYNKKIVPLSFSYSEKYIPDKDSRRDYFLFWVGRGYSKRYRYVNIAKEVLSDIPSIIHISKERNILYGQEEYSQKLLSSKVALNFKGYGWDSLRYYEIPAHRTLLFTKGHLLKINNDFTDEKNAIFFYSPEEMKEKLLYMISNPDYVDRIRLKGYEHFIKYHTTKIRAKQLLDKIKEVI